jgi:hypothetical protein
MMLIYAIQLRISVSTRSDAYSRKSPQLKVFSPSATTSLIPSPCLHFLEVCRVVREIVLQLTFYQSLTDKKSTMSSATVRANPWQANSFVKL